MIRRVRSRVVWLLIVSLLASGCQPTQPFFFMEDGDLSHYLEVATDIEYADVEEAPLGEVAGALPPLTVENFDEYTIRELSLEEVTRIALENGDILRQLGATIANPAPEALSRGEVNAGALTTSYDVALAESAYGANTGVAQSGTGVEAALAEFDAQVRSSMFWERNDRPLNVTTQFPSLFTQNFQQDLGRFSAEVNKFSADGTQWFFRNNTTYDANTNPNRQLFSDYNMNFEAGLVHPLLQGRGTQYNRIMGPLTFDQFAGGVANQPDGVVLARIRTDQTLADFEAGVIQFLLNVEIQYWELYFAYQNLDLTRIARDNALEEWKKDHAAVLAGDAFINERDEAQSAEQFHFFEVQLTQAVNQLLVAETRLRYAMGLSPSDGQLIRPLDEPTTALVDFDWSSAVCEAQARRVEIRKRGWSVKRRELELIGARNHLLPRLDAVAQYRWLGLGDRLIDTRSSGLRPLEAGSNAVESLTSGDFQEWQVGLQFSVETGFRRGLSAVRHHQLLLAQERRRLQELQLEISHQVDHAFKEVSAQHRAMQENFDRVRESTREVESWRTLREVGAGPPEYDPDRALNAQRRQFDASVAFYRALVDYNIAILRVHERKGSLLDYGGVQLAEGPWPAKAYFDALRRARRRDASTYLNYGFTRPDVMSRGPLPQAGGQDVQMYDAEGPYEELDGEWIPTPAEEMPPAGDGDAAPPADVTTDRAPPAPAVESSGGNARRPARRPSAAARSAAMMDPFEDNGGVVFVPNSEESGWASSGSNPLRSGRRTFQRAAATTRVTTEALTPVPATPSSPVAKPPVRTAASRRHASQWRPAR